MTCASRAVICCRTGWAPHFELRRSPLGLQFSTPGSPDSRHQDSVLFVSRRPMPRRDCTFLLIGHSPFELLFGRQPRTLLDMLAEQWEDTEEEVKDLLTYTRELRENLHTVWEEAHTALREAQNKQKRLYDTEAQCGP
ncbi:hypothetical protein NDU88_006469 [Pleurodeles waltl]|uniref:Uncharacterized protein n=1 Tax=Pleurodeles waltl TaxID=8319 RepID=A0AAV7TXY3_PLEWA|nr:hypothetical protein NDU88_006469 [Pleurodeles waltl]